MNGYDLAASIAQRFGTRDSLEIARLAGLSVRFTEWFPATLGELDLAARTITVNRRGAAAADVVAHELGHYFLAESGFRAGDDEERVCDDFARGLKEGGRSA